MPTTSVCDFDNGLETTDIPSDRTDLKNSKDKEFLDIIDQRKKKALSLPTQASLITEG